METLFVQTDSVIWDTKTAIFFKTGPHVECLYRGSLIIDLDYLLLVVLSKRDISHAPEMYIFINQVITNIECSRDEMSNWL